MNINVSNHPINKSITVPTSKSHTNRLLILASIYPETVIIKKFSHSTDVLILIDCLKKIGLEIEIDNINETLTIKNSFPNSENNLNNLNDLPIELNAGDGGTTNRFLLALLSRGSCRYKLHANNLMLSRPILELCNILRKFSVDISDTYPLELKGPAIFEQNKSGTEVKVEVEVDCSLSTQFLSALMLAFADKKINFVAKNALSSVPYIDLTTNTVKNFYHNLKVKKNNVFEVPADFSSIAYPAALALICGDAVTIKNCHSIDFIQADAQLFNIISENFSKNINDLYKIDSSGLRINKCIQKFSAIEVDCLPFPDLVPALAFICSYSIGESKLKNIKNLKFKESNRITEICRVLTIFNIKHKYDDYKDELSICGLEREGQDNKKKITPLDFHSPTDHRIAMMTYLFLRKNSGGNIYNWECVNKSFPNFFNEMF
ncbi:MAG: hypothetical protein HQK51_15220 [Oligoflexia bacterium]|nr:hypothetical protein [Oligoflexia bacterium]